MIAAFIMAGGSGERFWPLSTKERPKQLLKLIDPDRSMIRVTVDRILPMIPAERIFVGTNAIQAEAIREELPMLPAENIIVEPAFKDTAAAIGYGAVKINEELIHQGNFLTGAHSAMKNVELNEEVTMIVLASDHLIKNEENFRCRLEAAVESAKKNKSIVTLGIKPNKPETGYGYIETEECYIGEPAKVKRFWEKPSLERAEKYVEAGNYLWNSGMFIFQIDTMMMAFERYMLKHFEILEEIKTGLVTNDTNFKIIDSFEKFEKISIDFGIMEKAENIEVIPVDFGWNDIGSYPALDEVFEATETGTINRNGRVKEYNSKNNIVIGTGNKEIALLGINDMVVVETETEILICKKSEAQNIKKII